MEEYAGLWSLFHVLGACLEGPAPAPATLLEIH